VSLKLVYLQEYPFRVRDYHRLGLGPLSERFDVEIWDLSPHYCPRVYENIPAAQRPGSKARTFSSWREIRAALTGLPRPCFLVLNLSVQLRTWRLWRLMARLRLPYGLFATQALPAALQPVSATLPRVLPTINLYKLANFVFRNLLPSALAGMPRASVVVRGGEASRAAVRVNHRHLMSSSTQELLAHSLDYDAYLQGAPAERLVEDEYIVFLDENMVYHWEIDFGGLARPAEPDVYYQGLNGLFSVLEKRWGKRVVVAVHPSADPAIAASAFGHRECFQHQTMRLIRDCSLVVAHASTSVGYAVLYDKPVLLVTNRSVDAHSVGLSIDALARALGTRALFVEEAEHTAELPIADRSRYADYRTTYIKQPGSPELLHWEILGDWLEAGARSAGG